MHLSIYNNDLKESHSQVFINTEVVGQPPNQGLLVDPLSRFKYIYKKDMFLFFSIL